MSDIFYRNLVYAGAPLGALQVTARTLRSANGTSIEVLGCSRCSVSFLGLRTEFPIIICSLATGTDAIIGTDVLGSVLPHTLDIKNGLLFAQGGVSLQLHRKDSALSGRVFTVGHSSIPPYSEAVLHCSIRTTGGRALPSSGLLEGLTLFAEDTGLIVGRTLVDPSSRCLVYLDDIISFGGTFDGALSNLTLIFERLRSYGLQLKSSKCHLFRVSVPFLGHIVG